MVISEYESLVNKIKTCVQCDLCKTRTNAVPGQGSLTSKIMFVGEAPGAREDEVGLPFVGAAGNVLSGMLELIGLSRQEVYIANILKSQPPNNRDPKPEEAASCTPYLERQIELLRPRVILALGRIAAQLLLQSDSPIGRLRGRELSFGEEGTPLVASYHPAYLLRSPSAKAKAWEDLLLVRQLLRIQP